MKVRKILQLLTLVMGSIGIGLIIWKAGFWAALGIFLLMWSNNLSRDL